MAYKLQPGRMYRMPTHFGPSLGPRQGPDGTTYANEGAPKRTIVSVDFLTRREQLEAILPEGFTVRGAPVVTVSFSYIRDIPWLAGRGYNKLGVTFPATFQGQHERTNGKFMAVLWENLADPIITGREELGFAKVYCEIPPVQIAGERYTAVASWGGFRFLEMDVTVTELTDQNLERDDGALLHYKYLPRTGSWGEADVCYATWSPPPLAAARVTDLWRGEGSVHFRRAAWEELPTLVDVVNTLEGLELREYRGARVLKAVGAEDFRGQRILK